MQKKTETMFGRVQEIWKVRSSRRRVRTQREGLKCETQHGLLLFSAAGVREINILLYLSKQCDRPNIHEPWKFNCFPIPILTRQICQFFPHVVFCRTIKIKIDRPKRQCGQLLQLIQITIGQTLAYKSEPNISHKTFMNFSTKLVYQLVYIEFSS